VATSIRGSERGKASWPTAMLRGSLHNQPQTCQNCTTCLGEPVGAPEQCIETKINKRKPKDEVVSY